MIRTSEPAERLSAPAACGAYKRLSQVEQAFRCLKGIDLLVRPIHHRLEPRVRAHVLICVLAYYVEWHLRRAWRPLLIRGRGVGPGSRGPRSGGCRRGRRTRCGGRRRRIRPPGLCRCTESVPKGGLERRKGMNPKPYPSDLTSQQWAVLKPLLPPARTGGRPRKTEMRSVVNAIFYRNRNGCIWRALPHDFPPWRTVHAPNNVAKNPVGGLPQKGMD